MKTKTAYREKISAAENNPAPNIPDEPVQPSESVRVEFIDKTKPDAGTIASIDTAIPTDEAGEALKRQLEHLRASEQAQRLHAQQMTQQAQRPLSREEKLATWRASGGD